jgi:hypothetical protein
MATMHTPAPWTNDEAGFLGADGRPVGQPDRAVRDPAAMLRDFDRVKADRRLMTAAPALLEALRRLRGFASEYGHPAAVEAADGLLRQVDALIAEAEGR